MKLIQLYKLYNIDTSLFIEWRDTIAEMGKLIMFLLQHNQVIEEINTHKQEGAKSLTAYLFNVVADIIECVKKVNVGISKIILIFSAENNEPEVKELLDVLINCITKLEELVGNISLLQQVKEVPEIIKETILMMILLIPYFKHPIS